MPTPVATTRQNARAFARAHPHLALHVLAERDGEPPTIGVARGTVMDAAAERMARRDGGLVATTDADSVVADDWIAANLHELRDVDAVGGRVIPATFREADGLDHRYRFAIVRLESMLAPQAHDPWPRHGNHQGASLAMRTAAYARAGGVPAVRVLEDFGLVDALLATGATLRHSLRVRVVTSTRREGRAYGGFATHMHDLDEHVAGRRPYLVEHPADTIARIIASSPGIARPLVPIDAAIGSLEGYARTLEASAARPARINA